MGGCINLYARDGRIATELSLLNLRTLRTTGISASVVIAMVIRIQLVKVIIILILLLIIQTVIASNSTVILTSNAFTTNNVIYANIPDINKQVMCRPSNKNKLASFILDHFNRARVLLQRPAVGTNFNDYVELMLLYKINQFYHFNKRVTIFHTAGKIPIGYAQVLKCASQNILQNIGTMYSKGIYSFTRLFAYLLISFSRLRS